MWRSTLGSNRTDLVLVAGLPATGEIVAAMRQRNSGTLGRCVSAYPFWCYDGSVIVSAYQGVIAIVHRLC
eukprot:1434289-Rhodomonas_salina.1